MDENQINQKDSSLNEETNQNVVDENTSKEEVKIEKEETNKQSVTDNEVKTTYNRKLIDYNSSWVTMVIYLAYLIIIFFVQKNIFEKNANLLKNQYAFYFISLIVGLCSIFVIRNVFKIIFAYIAGYKLLYINFLGLSIEFNDKRIKFSAKLSFDTFLAVSMRFVSKDEKLDRNPALLFIGGFIGDLLFILICLLVYILNKPQNVTAMSLYSLFTLLYGLIVTIYELVPFRQDEATDMYNLIRTHSKDDRLAFNLYYINLKREQEGKDPLNHDFDDYYSFYKSQILYFNYLCEIYDNNLEEALKYVRKMSQAIAYIPDNDKYLATLELIYLRFLVDDEKEADRLYLNLKSENKSACIRPYRLASYKTSLLINAFITKDNDKVKNCIEGYRKLSRSLDERDSKRVTVENKLFIDNYNKVREKRPELNLPETINLD